LIRGPHRPQLGCSYPQTIIGKRAHQFNPDWFEEYDWLEYSEKVDKAFCLYWYLFRDCIEGQARNDAFVTKGFSGWNNKPRLDTHVGGVTSYHNVVVKRCNNLLKPSQSIEFALKKQQDIAKEEYFIRLSTSINAVRYSLHQGLSIHLSTSINGCVTVQALRELIFCTLEFGTPVLWGIDIPRVH
jgi:hypothetical protein